MFSAVYQIFNVSAKTRQAGRDLAILLAGLVFASSLAAAQEPREGSGRAQSRPPVASTQEVQRARQILGLFLRQGQREPYIGEQITRLYRGRLLLESRQVVKHAGPGRHRIEYLSPPERRGEVLLLIAGQIFNYKPGPPTRTLIGITPEEEFRNRVRRHLRAVREGRVRARVVGNEIVADRNAVIVELQSVGGGKRFWIDEKTGVRLKNEEIDPKGTIVSTSYFTKIDYNPSFNPKEFHPASLPPAPHEPLFPSQKPLASISEAQQRVTYTIREPSVPAGFRLDGVWVMRLLGPRRVTILRYTDGVNTFALFQQPLPAASRARRGSDSRPRVGRLSNDVVHWISGDRIYTLIGKLAPEAARQIVDSLS